MKNKFLIFPYIFLFIIFNYLPVLNLRASQIKKDQRLSTEYFDQLPSNEYIIGPGDTLSIIVSRDLGISTTTSVDGEGTINVPKLERVYVNGLTINELELLLNEALLEFIKFPNVEIIISRYRPIRIFVDGEVVNPGLKIMDGSLSLQSSSRDDSNFAIFSKGKKNSSENNNLFFPTVFDAIRASGGITQFSDLKSIKIIRKDSISNGSGKITTTLNFEDLLRLGENSQNIRIYDSDIIKVQRSNLPNTKILTKAILSNLNPRFINVFVTGRVNRPGPQSVSRASVLSDAVDMAGGAKVLRGPVTFIRFNSDGTIDKRKVKLRKDKRGKFNNPNLRDGDLIIVGDSLITATNEVIREFTSPFIGVFSTYGLIKAIND